MSRRISLLYSAIMVALLLPGFGAAQTDASRSEHSNKPVATVKTSGAPLFDDLGDYQHQITTNSPQAQRYFNQGLTLMYGFNHGEAIRSFKEGARLDPDCAMCYWGVAVALGPNINKPMDAADVPKAWDALQQAQRLAPKVSENERAYIKALGARYAPQPVKDRHSLDVAYADAMRQVMKSYPQDLDAATLFAEALMDTMPWDYYMEDRRPKAVTEELISSLEYVIAKDPQHPGANHFYIHAVEASPYPERALPSAKRLGAVAPGAGHLVHMPSHIYLRVGRYHDATLANEQAVKADEGYIAQCRAQGFYPAAYYPHNQHFLWYTFGMEGRSELAIETAREIDRMNDHQSLAEGKRFSPLLILTLARFGKWDEVLAQPKPPATELFATAMVHYARGMAQAGKLDLDASQRELNALEQITQSSQIKALDQPQLPGAKLIVLSKHVLAGELASRRSQNDEMNRQFTSAIQLEDKLPYMEPPYWHHPVRQIYGDVLLQAGKSAEAEAMYRQDLKRNPANGWSLYGLLASLREQGKTEEANAVEKRFREAWRLADVTLTASRF
jgi:tetratricopeptide (TPR) repeat protein